MKPADVCIALLAAVIWGACLRGKRIARNAFRRSDDDAALFHRGIRVSH
jgi:hypothetical protein